MDLKDLGRSIVAVAPTLGAALAPATGGVSVIVGSALGALGKVFGLEAPTPASVAAAVQNATPEQLLALKKADNDFAAHMADLGVDLAELAAGDRDSARRREMAVRDRTPAQLAWVLIGGFIFISAAQIFGVTFFPELVQRIPSQGWLLIGNISGYLANEAKQAAAYYFGASPPEAPPVRP